MITNESLKVKKIIENDAVSKQGLAITSLSSYPSLSDDRNSHQIVKVDQDL